MFETNKKIQAIETHLKENPTDFKGWLKLFDEYDKLFLDIASKKYPNSVIRSPNSDLITCGLMSGIGGCVPAEWDGSIYDWNGKQITK